MPVQIPRDLTVMHSMDNCVPIRSSIRNTYIIYYLVPELIHHSRLSIPSSSPHPPPLPPLPLHYPAPAPPPVPEHSHSVGPDTDTLVALDSQDLDEHDTAIPAGELHQPQPPHKTYPNGHQL